MTDTADLYATGLIERSAAAFASGVPEGTGDDGLFGPASVTWRTSADLAAAVAGLRSLLMQALHPLADGRGRGRVAGTPPGGRGMTSRAAAS